jgi:hypothetical protein
MPPKSFLLVFKTNFRAEEQTLAGLRPVSPSSTRGARAKLKDAGEGTPKSNRPFFKIKILLFSLEVSSVCGKEEHILRLGKLTHPP